MDQRPGCDERRQLIRRVIILDDVTERSVQRRRCGGLRPDENRGVGPLLLVAMFPANVRADRAGLTLGGKAVSRLRPRTAIQAAFLLAAVAAI